METYITLNQSQEKAIRDMMADYVIRGTLIDKSVVVTLKNGVKITLDESGKVIKAETAQ